MVLSFSIPIWKKIERLKGGEQRRFLQWQLQTREPIHSFADMKPGDHLIRKSSIMNISYEHHFICIGFKDKDKPKVVHYYNKAWFASVQMIPTSLGFVQEMTLPHQDFVKSEGELQAEGNEVERIVWPEELRRYSEEEIIDRAVKRKGEKWHNCESFVMSCLCDLDISLQGSPLIKSTKQAAQQVLKSLVARPQPRLDAELGQARTDSTEWEELLQDVELMQMRRLLNEEIHLREAKEQELIENERIVSALQRTLGEEQRARTAVEQELSHASIAFTKQEELLRKEIAHLHRRIDDKERIASDLQRLLGEERQARTRVDEELRQVTIASTELEARLGNDLAQMRRTLTDKDRIVKELQRTLVDERQARTTAEEELGQSITKLQERLLKEEQTSQSRQLDLQAKDDIVRGQRCRVEEKHQEMTVLEERLRSMEIRMEEERNRNVSEASAMAQSRDWIIQRNEVVLSDNILGRGAWGIVRKGLFRGCQVAVKEIYEVILSDHNRRLFEREMSIASRCRHPNLLQFIGATNHEGNPLFVTELLDTSLRHVLSQRALNHEEIISLALDIAKGLNYLHLNKPHPIMHRDVSSANVLLRKREDNWSAKVSDYGAANFMRKCMTEKPGAVIYAAPEAFTPKQTPKVDVYSFGVLLCEMCTREQPDPEQIHNQMSRVTGSLRGLIQRCVERDPEARPTMSDVIRELEQFA